MNFTPEDFPDQAEGLKGLGVTRLSVGYKIDGATPVIGLLDIKPVTVPETITECW